MLAGPHPRSRVLGGAAFAALPSSASHEPQALSAVSLQLSAVKHWILVREQWAVLVSATFANPCDLCVNNSLPLSALRPRQR
jgi:hypothetical protein